MNSFVEDLIAYLRQKGYPLESERIERLRRLCHRLPPSLDYRSIKKLIAPAFALDHFQQIQFSALYDQFIAEHPEYATETTKSLNKNSHVPSTPSHRLLTFFSRRWFYWLMQVLMIAFLCFLGYSGTNCYIKHQDVRGTLRCMFEGTIAADILQVAPSIDQTSLSQTQTNNTAQAFPQITIGQDSTLAQLIDPKPPIAISISDLKATFLQKYGLVMFFILLAFILSTWLFIEIYSLVRTQWIKDQAKTQKETIYELPEEVEQAYSFSNEMNVLPANTILGEHTADSWLVLIEKKSLHDHFSWLVSSWLKCIAEEGIIIEIFYYEVDPRLCWRTPFLDDILIKDLHKHFPQHRLVIFGDVLPFFDSQKGTLAEWISAIKRWDSSAVFTPKTPIHWQAEELHFLKEFKLIPACMDAVKALLGHFRGDSLPDTRHWFRTYPIQTPITPHPSLAAVPVPSASPTSLILQAEIDSPRLSQWISATCLYHKIYWPYTVQLAKELLAISTFDHPLWLALIQQEAFRIGYFPEEQRAKYLSNISVEAERTARKALFQSLPKEAVIQQHTVPDQNDLYMSLQKALEKPNLVTQGHLYQQIQDYASQYELEDPAFIHQLEKAPAFSWSSWLPEKLKQVLFRQGIPLLGPKSNLKLAIPLIAISLLFLIVEPERIQHMTYFGGTSYYLDSKVDRMRYYTYLGNSYLQDSTDYTKANRCYQRAILISKDIQERDFLIPHFNQALVHINQQKWTAADQQYATLLDSSESLLAQTTLKASKREELIQIHQQSLYQRGYIAFHEDELEAADAYFLAAASNDSLTPSESRYARGVVLLKQAMEPSATSSKPYMSIAISELQNARKEDTLIFQRHSKLEKLFPALRRMAENTRLDTSQFEELKSIIAPTQIDSSLLRSRLNKRKLTAPSVRRNSSRHIRVLSPTDNDDIIRIVENGKFGLAKGDSIIISPQFDYILPVVTENIAFSQGGLWGFKSIKADDTFSIEPEFDEVTNFQQLKDQYIASVRKGTYWALILANDTTYTLLTSFKYDHAIVFRRNSSYAKFQHNGLFGYLIFSENQIMEVIPPIYHKAFPFNKGNASVVKNGVSYRINEKGECISETCPPPSWNLRLARTITFPAAVEDVSFSPDGKWLAVAGNSQKIILYALDNPEDSIILHQHTTAVSTVSFSKEANKLVSTSRSGEIAIWNYDGTLLQFINEAPLTALNAVFLPSSTERIVAAFKEGKIKGYQWGKEPSSQFTLELNDYSINTINYSPSNDILASAVEDSMILLWNLSSEKLLDSIKTPSPILTMLFSPDGHWIALGLNNGMIRFESLSAQNSSYINPVGGQRISDMMFSSDGQFLITSSDRTLSLWDWERAQLWASFTAGKSVIQCFAISPRNSFIATGTLDGHIILWEIQAAPPPSR